VLAVATVTAAGPEAGTAVRLLHVEGAATLARVVVGTGWGPLAQLGWRLYTPPQTRAAPSFVTTYAESVRALLPLPEGGGGDGGVADPVALDPSAALPLLGVWDADGHWQLRYAEGPVWAE
jgi:hypothetical protein